MLYKTNSKANFYIYRNLHKGESFSIKYKGKVIARLDKFTAFNCDLKVNEHGRQKTLATKQRNVHAYVVCNAYEVDDNYSIDGCILNQLQYNPFTSNKFRCESKDINYAEEIHFVNGKAYLVKEDNNA